MFSIDRFTECSFLIFEIWFFISVFAVVVVVVCSNNKRQSIVFREFVFPFFSVLHIIEKIVFFLFLGFYFYYSSL